METNEAADDIKVAATRKVRFILEINGTMRNCFGSCLKEKNHRITFDELSLTRDIIFRFYNEFLLHDIDRQQFLCHTIPCQNDQTMNYFVEWFKCFLCDSNPDWMCYIELLNRWTNCFVRNNKLFRGIINQIDELIELWERVETDNNKRSTYFVKHMVYQCFQAGKIIYRLTVVNINVTNDIKEDVEVPKKENLTNY